MCSATQAGFLVRRSYEDVKDAAGLRSATGPGKPYWKRPEGSTGAGMLAEKAGEDSGTGGAGVVEEGVVTVVVIATEGVCGCLRVP